MVVDLKKLEKAIKQKKKDGKKDILKSKIVSKNVLKKSKTTITVKEKEPADYVPIYFQAELKKTKEDMGFWK